MGCLLIPLFVVLGIIFVCTDHFVALFILLIFAPILIWAGCIGDAKRIEQESQEREFFQNRFQNQKYKVKLISGYFTSDVEKEVNKFIHDKKVLNVTFDDNRNRVTATILYEDL